MLRYIPRTKSLRKLNLRCTSYEFVNPTNQDYEFVREMWVYPEGVEVWFRDSIVEKLFLPKHLDPLLQDGLTVKQLLTDYGLPEVLYERYTETAEGNGIAGWLFVYPTRGEAFVISSMFPILPGHNQPPPPVLLLMGRSQYVPGSTSRWLEAYGGNMPDRILDIDEYLSRMDAEIHPKNPVWPQWEPQSQ